MTPPSTRLLDRDRLASLADVGSAAFVRSIQIDLRALAAFRIAIGALVIVDLLRRSRNLEAFYTDRGVLPLEALFADYTGTVYSLHALSGELWVQQLLFGITGVAALALLLGYRSRLATVLTWGLVLSLHTRNPLVLNGGDVLLRMLLFWAIFLPLGERWSIDASRFDRDRSVVASIGTLAILLQVFLMYGTNAIHKLRSEQWRSGEAIGLVLQADHLTILLGNALAPYPELLRVATYAWFGLLLASPLLFLLRGSLRALLVAAFAGMHLGMLVTLRIDIFPLISVAGLLLFLPPVVWDRFDGLSARIRRHERLGPLLQRPAGTLVGSVRSLFPEFASPAARGLARPDGGRLPDRPSLAHVLERGRAVVWTLVPAAMVLLVLMSNAEAVGYTDVPERADQALETVDGDQNWRLFAPNPTRTTRWYAARGYTVRYNEVDPLHGRSDVVFDRPPDPAASYDSPRWRKFYSHVYGDDYEQPQSYLANYLCQEWNESHDVELDTLTLYYMYERHDPYDGTSSSDRERLLEYDCSGDLIQY